MTEPLVIVDKGLWQALMVMVDRPPVDTPKLRRLLATDPLILPDEPEPDFPDVPNDPVPDLGPEAPDEPTLPKED